MSVLGSGVAPGGATFGEVMDSWCLFDDVSEGLHFGLIRSGPVDRMLVCLQV